MPEASAHSGSFRHAVIPTAHLRAAIGIRETSYGNTCATNLVEATMQLEASAQQTAQRTDTLFLLSADSQDRAWLKWQHEIVATLRQENDELEQLCAHEIDWTLFGRYFRDGFTACAALETVSRQLSAIPE
jgi:hypothetical protein